MQDAVEMAVLSTVQHPNIVSVYSCLTDMVECEGLDASASTGGALRTRYRRLRPEEDPEGEATAFNIVVMEVGRVAQRPGGGSHAHARSPLGRRQGPPMFWRARA
jgi:hypothetical protein